MGHDTEGAFLTPEDLAQKLRIPRARVMAFCAAREWPHVRFGRLIRFSPEQVEQITALHAVNVRREPLNPWGRVRRRGL